MSLRSLAWVNTACIGHAVEFMSLRTHAYDVMFALKGHAGSQRSAAVQSSVCQHVSATAVWFGAPCRGARTVPYGPCDGGGLPAEHALEDALRDPAPSHALCGQALPAMHHWQQPASKQTRTGKERASAGALLSVCLLCTETAWQSQHRSGGDAAHVYHSGLRVATALP